MSVMSAYDGSLGLKAGNAYLPITVWSSFKDSK